MKKILVATLLFCIFFCCKGNKQEKNNLSSPQKEERTGILKDDTFRISFFAEFPKDNIFMFWYLDNKNENFSSNKSLTKTIIGSEGHQEIAFVLAPKDYIEKFRFRPVKSISQNTLVMDSIVMTYNSRKLTLKPSNYSKYLRMNPYVKWDSISKAFQFIEVDNAEGETLFDPFIISNELLSEKLLLEL